jgi:hypothetical protein
VDIYLYAPYTSPWRAHRETLPYSPPVLTHVAHATSNIRRTFIRQIALLCNHCCLKPALAPNVSKQYTTARSLTLPPASRLQQSSRLFPLHFPRVWVCGRKCESRTVGTDLEESDSDLFLGNCLLLHISPICDNSATTQNV